MKVYIVFGDTPRSDGDNIESVHFLEALAEERVKSLKKIHGDDALFSIECFEVEM